MFDQSASEPMTSPSRGFSEQGGERGTDITEAVVLAAGEGSRLRPLTEYRPKPMLHVGDRPILEYVLDALAGAGVERVALVVGHGKMRVQNHFENRYRGLELRYVEQGTRLGSGHALQQAADQLSGTFLVVNGDNLVDERTIRGLVDRYRQDDAAVCLSVVKSDRTREYEVVRTDDSTVRSVSDPGDGGPAPINAGVYAVDERVFAALERTPFVDGERSLTAALDAIDGRVVAETSDGIWYDPSYPWDLLATNEALLSEHPDLLTASIPVDETARVHRTAEVGDDALVGPDCEVCAGAVLRRGTCLQANTRVGANAVIERSILGPDVRVGAGAVLRNSIVGPGAEVGAGTVAPGRSATVVINGREYADRRLGTVVADRATVGPGSTLTPGVRIGPGADVGMGATVRRDVPGRAEVIG